MSRPSRNSEDKLLFTPGPLTTSSVVKESMLTDLGSRDEAFLSIVKDIRHRLLRIGDVSKEDGFESLIFQGSGTYGIEAVISSSIPKDGHLLLIINGAYGERMLKIAKIHSIKTSVLRFPENQVPEQVKVKNCLIEDASISHIAMVHCETTTGIMNDVKSVGELALKYKKTFILDAMSSFGGVTLNIKRNNIDILVSSSNKCIEGVPGFSFVIARRSVLESARDQARTLSLDLYEQWRGLEENGQFRFTPPVQVIAAFHKALIELEKEGGVEARSQRYKENFRILKKGMTDMGFEMYLDPEVAGHIITAFRYPEKDWFDFETFYSTLNERGFIIYPGKLSQENCFRIGNIGQLYPEDIRNLLLEIGMIQDL